MAEQDLHVIALISGGKDSFFSLLHCMQHGHRIVALANLFPAPDSAAPAVQVIDPSVISTSGAAASGDDGDGDLNSFMYQTVGHEIIPLYAAATGLPLYRLPICSTGAQRHERDYAFNPAESAHDETESMTVLLKAIMERHPEANAVSAGAILSTYQRTRVESVALRLGLTPLAYLWKYPTLPPPASASADGAQLLKDMAAVGLEARIIKVASAGLSEQHLWECVASDAGAGRVKAALQRFGAAGGAVLGEGGEFETIVLDGPSRLFRKRIKVASEGRTPVQEGGGTTWLMLRNAFIEDKAMGSEMGSSESPVRVPDILEPRFQSVMDQLSDPSHLQSTARPPPESKSSITLGKPSSWTRCRGGDLIDWFVVADETVHHSSIEAETAHVVDKIRVLLASHSLKADHVSNTMVILRRMSDFPSVNAEYGKLFQKPNPPSRVTVSCGDLLQPGGSIAIYLAVDPVLSSHVDRQGLHVQSRSYWAPANIGPYSQAVGTPIWTSTGTTGLRTWSVAGQIPLIPSSMALPGPPDEMQLQISLSLQHLWRIAVDVKVQFWTSAVAFFARSTSEEEMQRKATMGARAWRLAHGSPQEDDEDDEDGPDPWDLKFNQQYQTLAGTDQEAKEPPLPDWSVMTLRHQNEPDTCIPPFFAVEVEELPRQSAVEWQAHTGLSGLGESSVETLHFPEIPLPGWKAWHTIARGQQGEIFRHTVLAYDLDATSGPLDYSRVVFERVAAHRVALQAAGMDDNTGACPQGPYLTYVDAANVNGLWNLQALLDSSAGPALIPCRSLWSSTGARLGVVSLYRTTFTP